MNQSILPNNMGQNADDQQKDMLAMLFPPGFNSDHSQLNPSSVQPSTSNTHFQFSPPSNMDMLSNIVPDQSQPQSQAQAQYNPQLLMEQQIRISQFQQLQQLQTQIFQQQIALIGGPNGAQSPEQPREPNSPYNPLPTPGPSNELRAQPSTMDFVSPMMLDYMDPNRIDPSRRMTSMDLLNRSQSGIPEGMQSDMHPSNQHRYSLPPRGSTSAPADIAFGTHPSDMDFDVSPLTSPWLGPNHRNTMDHNPRMIPHNNNIGHKRPASSSSDDSRPARKKTSPAVRPTASSRTSRSSKSTTSTPLIGRHHSIVPADTPSPVDLSMLPPAPPPGQLESDLQQQRQSKQQGQQQSQQQHILPVTPASIMNMSRPIVNADPGPSQMHKDDDAKGKSSMRARTSVMRSSSRKNSTASSSSPSLKNILPAGSPSITSKPNANNPPKKTSHKAAEQKRRDSMKMTYDELRVLLPTIPLTNSPSSPSIEPLLPGALPPRGPPKAGGDGPNKAVSKLQLLICANGFIKKLTARVDRRDREIDVLRDEIRRLQGLNLDGCGDAQFNGGGGEGLEIDLEKDLDEIEKYEKESIRMFEGDGDDDDD